MNCIEPVFHQAWQTCLLALMFSLSRGMCSVCINDYFTKILFISFTSCPHIGHVERADPPLKEMKSSHLSQTPLWPHGMNAMVGSFSRHSTHLLFIASRCKSLPSCASSHFLFRARTEVSRQTPPITCLISLFGVGCGDINKARAVEPKPALAWAMETPAGLGS